MDKTNVLFIIHDKNIMRKAKDKKVLVRGEYIKVPKKPPELHFYTQEGKEVVFKNKRDIPKYFKSLRGLALEEVT